MSAQNWANLFFTVCFIAFAARLYVLDKDVSRVCTAVSVIAREAQRLGTTRPQPENGGLLAAFLFVEFYDQLSPKVRSQIPQRLYLWAVEQTAQARLQHADKAAQHEPADLTELAQQIPPSLPG